VGLQTLIICYISHYECNAKYLGVLTNQSEKNSLAKLTARVIRTVELPMLLISADKRSKIKEKNPNLLKVNRTR
jgi:hypothetical protein